MLNRKTLSAVFLGCAFAVSGCAADEGTSPGGASDLSDIDIVKDDGTDTGTGGATGTGTGAGTGAGTGGGAGTGTGTGGGTDTGNGDVNVGSSPQAFQFSNGLLPTCFWSVGAQKTLRALGKGPIADDNGMLPKMTSILPLCYDTIKYAVQCALDNNTAVTNPHNGEVYHGVVGLAPNWRTQPLDVQGRRWVTACMVQRLNALGLPVSIELEGDHTPLNGPATDDFPFSESSAFGDLFSSTAPLTGLAPAFTAYICSEDDTALACLNVANLLQLRLCDNIGLLCGVEFIGRCSSKCSANGPYWTCPNYGYSQTIRVHTGDNFCL